jgi:hypothetical protein
MSEPAKAAMSARVFQKDNCERRYGVEDSSLGAERVSPTTSTPSRAATGRRVARRSQLTSSSTRAAARGRRAATATSRRATALESRPTPSLQRSNAVKLTSRSSTRPSRIQSTVLIRSVMNSRRHANTRSRRCRATPPSSAGDLRHAHRSKTVTMGKEDCDVRACWSRPRRANAKRRRNRPCHIAVHTPARDRPATRTACDGRGLAESRRRIPALQATTAG